MLYAHYYASKTTKFVLLSSDIRATENVKRIAVTGKTEAKKIAKANNAQAWNF
jgi:hypothetical protein